MLGLGQLPQKTLNGTPNTREGCGNLEQYWTVLLKGLRAGAKKQNNMKTAATAQKADQLPFDFYGRFYKAFQIYMSFDPEAQENSKSSLRVPVI